MTKLRHQLSVCFVAQNAYGILAGLDSGFLGGIEVQIPLMARWFAQRGDEVTLIGWDEGFGKETEISGIRVISLCKRDEGIPGVRFFTPRWTSLYRALNVAQPHIIYYNYGDLGLGEIAIWARLKKVPLVYSVANDMVCLRNLPSLEPMREKLLYAYGLRRADKVISQTSIQRESLLSNFSIDSEVIPMPSMGFGDGTARQDFPSDDEVRILWVGRFTTEKRLEWFLELARRFPQYKFEIVGGASVKSNYSINLEEDATLIPNVSIQNRVLHHEMGDVYRKATLLCSTSVFEGFPNVFLEAWSTGLPVVATSNPDHTITEHNLGAVGSNLDELAAAIKEALIPSKWRKASENAVCYFDQNHQLENVITKFESAILEPYQTKTVKENIGLPVYLMKDYPDPQLICHSRSWEDTQPEFSIVTATYQRCSEISKLLASISKQLELNPDLYEHIICDNASTDGTSELVKDYIDKNDHIATSYYVQSENFGLDKNIQDALRLARGKYVWFLADDDDIAPGKLAEVAENCLSSQLPLVIVRANGVGDWNSIKPAPSNQLLQIIDPRKPEWASVVYATSFLASMVFSKDQIEQFQGNVYPAFGTSYTPWALGLSIISNAREVGYIDDLCTLGNTNFDGNNRFPSYRVLIKGRVQVWDICATGEVKQNLKTKVIDLAADGWRALAAGKLEVGKTRSDLISEYYRSIKYLGARMILSIPWIVVAVVFPKKMRTSLDNIRLKIINEITE